MRMCCPLKSKFENIVPGRIHVTLPRKDDPPLQTCLVQSCGLCTAPGARLMDRWRREPACLFPELVSGWLASPHAHCWFMPV